jgi:geranylgeranyl pyrophosphate synthase
MRYSALAPGKRIRPILTYITGEALGADEKHLAPPALAVELIHAYSLIHDDLPAMDDDDLRRGRPTCHRKFDEATAILAGDALQALAFQVLLQGHKQSNRQNNNRAKMALILAQASGSAGMAGGQAMDLAAVGKNLSIGEIEAIHEHKTGALIQASVHLGYLASSQQDEDLESNLREYAACIGLAFQVQDDILDVEGQTEIIGKPKGSDANSDKPTYPELLGLEGAKTTAKELCIKAKNCLSCLGKKSQGLKDIADYIISRDR